MGEVRTTTTLARAWTSTWVDDTVEDEQPACWLAALIVPFGPMVLVEYPKSKMACPSQS